MKPVGITSAIVLLLSLSYQAQSQTVTRLSLDSCISVALRSNPSIQSSQLQVTQQQKLQKTAFDLGTTSVFIENEDISATDEGILKIGVAQRIDFPTTWIAQGNVNRQRTLIARTSLSSAQNQLVRHVRSTYFNLWLAVERQKLWTQQDSVFTEFENAAVLRFTTGETNKLEVISAQAKHKEIQLALAASSADVAIAQQQLMVLLNTQDAILPVDEPMKKLSTDREVLPVSSDHPFLQISQQRIALAKYQKRVEVNNLLPDLSVRYFNQNWYGAEPGYRGYSIGVGIPIFFWSQQGRIQAARLEQEIAQKNFENDLSQFNGAYQQALHEYRKHLSLLEYYEATGLQQSNEILSTATQAYREGEIGYLEYTILLSQSIDIKNSYLSALNNFNQAVIEVNYYINQ